MARKRNPARHNTEYLSAFNMRIVSKKEPSMVITQKITSAKALNTTIVAIISHGVENMYLSRASILFNMFVASSIKYFKNPVPIVVTNVRSASINRGNE
jgi:hypothetical protein